MDEMVKIQFCAPVSESLIPLEKNENWGFYITDGTEHAYVSAGDKKVVRKHLNDNDSLFCLFFEAIRESENEVANEFLDLIMDEKQSILINGEEMSHAEIQRELAEFGIEE